MSIENPQLIPRTPLYEMDLSHAWDTESQAELFLMQLKKLKIYKQDLRFAGFDGSKINKESHSNRAKDVVFCSTESDLFSGGGGENENSLEYAYRYNEPAIAVYDNSKLEKDGDYGIYGYKISEPSALIAIIRLK